MGPSLHGPKGRPGRTPQRAISALWHKQRPGYLYWKRKRRKRNLCQRELGPAATILRDLQGPEGGVALSDNGNSFFEDGESILMAVGFKDHRFYPVNVHQFLSENDNRLHGTSKASW